MELAFRPGPRYATEHVSHEPCDSYGGSVMSRRIMLAAMILLGLPLLGFSGMAAAEEAMFPFVVSYDAPENVTNVAAWLRRPAGKHGFVRAEDGRLATDAGPDPLLGHELLLRGLFPQPRAGRARGRAAGPAGHQLRADAPHGHPLDLGRQPEQADDRPEEARAARLPDLSAQAARRLHEPQPARLAMVRRGRRVSWPRTSGPTTTRGSTTSSRG